jgi:hypothetical protein
VARRSPGRPRPLADGLRRARLGRSGAGAGGPERVGPSGSVRSSRIVFFFEFIFNAKNNSRKCRNCFKGTKNTRKITNIPEKFLEIDYDMNNPNKAFGAHEKDF